MVQLRNKQLRRKIRELDEHILEDYKKIRAEERTKRDYMKYEKDFMKRLKKAVKSLEPLINEAVKDFSVYKGKGGKPKLSFNKKLRMILVKQLVDKSNRNMAYLTGLFSTIKDVDVSYKTVERLYSDPEVYFALHNFFILLLKKKNVNNIDGSGDATGYSLIISKHYATEAQKLKEKAKTQTSKKKIFVYKFVILDLKTRMYACYGTSLISEKKAFEKAIKMLKDLEIDINTLRLDKYYSFPSYLKLFPKATVYIIPRKNSKLGHGIIWLRTMKKFTQDTINYLREYYKREASENSFGCDKKMFGWKIQQKREDRIDTAAFVKTIWHNLIWLHKN